MELAQIIAGIRRTQEALESIRRDNAKIKAHTEELKTEIARLHQDKRDLALQLKEAREAAGEAYALIRRTAGAFEASRARLEGLRAGAPIYRPACFEDITGKTRATVERILERAPRAGDTWLVADMARALDMRGLSPNTLAALTSTGLAVRIESGMYQTTALWSQLQKQAPAAAEDPEEHAEE